MFPITSVHMIARFVPEMSQAKCGLSLSYVLLCMCFEMSEKRTVYPVVIALDPDMNTTRGSGKSCTSYMRFPETHPLRKSQGAGNFLVRSRLQDINKTLRYITSRSEIANR
jgi:hypothetical protein